MPVVQIDLGQNDLRLVHAFKDRLKLPSYQAGAEGMMDLVTALIRFEQQGDTLCTYNAAQVERHDFSLAQEFGKLKENNPYTGKDNVPVRVFDSMAQSLTTISGFLHRNGLIDNKFNKAAAMHYAANFSHDLLDRFKQEKSALGKRDKQGKFEGVVILDITP